VNNSLNNTANTKPNTLIGVGLRHSHYAEVLGGAKQNVDFVEVHAENFFASGGASRSLIHEIAEAYPLSVHGTSLGLGSTLATPKNVLQQFTELVKSTQPILVSEHLCFNRAEVNGNILHSGDLLPIPYNLDSLNNIVAHIQHVQDSIQRPLLIENLSAYISPSQLAAENQDKMTEFEFLVAMCKQSGCGLLLDLNNLIINELNKSVYDPLGAIPLEAISFEAVKQRISTLPASAVGEIHLAGYTDQSNNLPLGQPSFIIDDHGAPVSDQCWDLYQFALHKFPNTPTLVEWDTQIPEWSVLLAEADKARRISLNAKL
jgi:uncharacterized protein (UPF0276 family)